MINKKIISDFADIIGNIEISISLDSYRNVKYEYEKIKEKLLQWVNIYYEKRNFDFISYVDSLNIHDQLADIKYKILPDKNIGMESVLCDNILIRYEVIIKEINDERSKKNVKR